MLEVLAGTGLAAAAGLNAYIPLLTLGLAGRFLDFVVLPDGGDDALYEDLGDGALASVSARLVPYFAWGNRGPSEMSVWLPVAW